MAIVATITIDDTGNMRIDGFPDNLIMSFGLLEIAKLALVQRHEAQKNAVQLASGPLPSSPFSRQ